MATATNQALTVGTVIGALLIVIGIAAYVVTDFASVTALIPAIFGVLFVGLGLAGSRTEHAALAVYGLAGLSVLGIAGSTRGIPDLLELLTGDTVDAPVAVGAQGAMILCSLVVLVAAVRAVAADR
ncbi:hypothetical protein [Natronosalvus vescus]|uniref:hypothetical protein n=1 Tax=Natronosalvus vescus TaxID=2953881 RepID=UPI002090296C|nr:hypothetical protein [Natronosalvus vescus]